MPFKPQEVTNSMDLRVRVYARIDDTDNLILSIFRRYPSRSLKASTILNILEYEGVSMSPGQLRDRLRKLVILGLVCRHKGNRVDRYSLPASQDP